MRRTTERLLQDAGLEISENETLPSVVIVTANPEILPQKYDNQIVVQRKENEPQADLFNRATSKEEGNYFVFLDKNFDFSHPHVVKELVELMESTRLVGFGGAYSDLHIMNDGVLMCIRFNPAYSINLIKNRVVMNFPFILSTRYGVPRFTEGLEVLTLWDGIIQLMVTCPMYHVPSPLFTMKNVLTNPDIENEIKLINETHYS